MPSRSDSVPVWLGVRDRPGADVPVLLPVAQGARYGLLLRRHPGGAGRLAAGRHDHRALRLRRPLQVGDAAVPGPLAQRFIVCLYSSLGGYRLG